jgi:hypothetical protein
MWRAQIAHERQASKLIVEKNSRALNNFIPVDDALIVKSKNSFCDL